MHNVDEPHVALSVTDPDNPYRYLELRGVLDKIEGDPAERSSTTL